MNRLRCLLTCVSLSSLNLFAQQPILQAGSLFPDVLIRNISNAPIKEINLNQTQDKKLYLLNFWGTWCSPCIPEMDALARLQEAYKGKMQVIAISDDSQEKKQKYSVKKPSGIWLATDTNYTLYKMLGLASVGNCAVINADRKIVAVLNTDSITPLIIDKLLNGEEVTSNAYLKESAIKSNEDAFGVDSLLQESVCIRGYMRGQPTMSKRYLTGPFKGRRASWFNLSIPTIYRNAFRIHSPSQEVYDSSVNRKELNNFEDMSSLYCVDILVSPNQLDSLNLQVRQALIANLPVKARLEEKLLPVYLLIKRTDTTVHLLPSKALATSYGYSGNGYEGQKVTIATFASDYLTNELDLPVIDETGLKGEYDIKTTIDLRTKENIQHSVNLMGLVLEKGERKIPVLVYYR